MPDEPTSDDHLAALLRIALCRSDPVPDHVHEGALNAFAFRDLDGMLAELVNDSLAVVRDDDERGPLVFETEHVEIAVEVTDGRLVGQLAPPEACRGIVDSPNAEPKDFLTDDLGCFTIDVPHGPLRVVVRHPSGPVRTEWFRT